MKLAWQLLLSIIWASFLETAWSQPLTVSTLAGKFGRNGYVNGVGTNSQFHGLNNFSDLAVDPNGFLYVVDGNSVRRISPDLSVITLAGSAVQAGYKDGPGTNALFSNPAGVAADATGNVYVADHDNYAIRKITPAGVVSTVAGDGTYGYVDSAAGTPKFQGPSSVALDSAGNLYVADYTTLRKITRDGVVSTLAGTQSPGFDDGTGASARFISPFFLATKADGNLFVAMNSVIRQVTPTGTVTTWAGGNGQDDLDGIGAKAGFAGANSIALDKAGGAYVADSFAGTIRYITPAGVVTTVAGKVNRFPIPGSNDGVGDAAFISNPLGIAVDSTGNVYVVDGGKYTVLKGVPPSLPAIGSFSESPGVTPVRSNNPWRFTASYSTLVSDLRLHVQSSTTASGGAGWTDLPGGGQMTHQDTTWTSTSRDVPSGTRYFRAVASAPGYLDGVSTAVGPESVLEGIAPFGDFTWETTFPHQTGVAWRFMIIEPSFVSDLRLRVQSSATPDSETSWSDLPGGGQMVHRDSTWSFTTTNLPTGTQSFRVVASAPNYSDRTSAALGPFAIGGTLPPVRKSNSTSGTYSLASLLEPDPKSVYLQAVEGAFVSYFYFDTARFNSAVILAAQQYAAAVLKIEAAQNVGILAVNMGQNSVLQLKGAIKGDVSLISQDGNGIISQDGNSIISQDGNSIISQDGNSIISQDGNSLISQDGNGVISNDGGTLAFDLGTASVVSHNGGNVVSHDGGSFVSSGLGNVVSHNGGNIFGPQGGVSPPPSVTSGRRGGVVPRGLPIQPAFTGIMTVDGNYSQFPGGALLIGIAGPSSLSDGAQQYDQLVVKGTANLLGGTIAYGLLNPNDQTNQVDRFEPREGDYFDVVVATNIVAGSVKIRGPIWGDGMFFDGTVVSRTDGMQAIRLMATHVAPKLFLQATNSQFQLIYATNFVGYTVESSPSLSSPNWTAFSSGTNRVNLSPSKAGQFFRVTKP